MSLEQQMMTAIKDAMKSKDQVALAALRAVKSELLLAKTSGDNQSITDEEEIKVLQKLVKQRKDSARIYNEQDRNDLADIELAQADVLQQFLPEQLSESDITAVVNDIIAQTGASGMKDMGKVMGMANKQLSGKADGRTISTIVKTALN